jgi:isopropylmalate/homocitrate/citramalate synthase
VTGCFKNVFDDNPTTVFPVHPDFVGHATPQILMGKKSGLDNIAIWSKKLNIDLNDDEAMAVLKEVKLQSHDLKRVLTEGEFREIVERVRG